MKQEKNRSVRKNVAGENTAKPIPISKGGSAPKSAPLKGSPKPIPSTMGYIGKRIK